MHEGRDLRNKAAIFKGHLYSIGGNNFTAERLNLIKNEWIQFSSYNKFVSDNLDSWCCSLAFELNENNNSN